MKRTIFLKLGGSLVTDKQKAYTFNEPIVKQIVEEIAECREKNPELKIVLGNGAGSFAHQSAAKYQLNQGATDQQGRFGACFTHTDAVQLNYLIARICLESSLPVFSLQPSAYMLSSGGQTIHTNFSIVQAILDQGMIPFIYGDVVIDTKIGATVYSTDRIFREMAEAFAEIANKPDLVIHAGNYDGVINRQEKVINNITKNNYEEIKKNFYESGTLDVTGGMAQKVEEMLKLTDIGISSLIINGGKKNLIYNSLLGDISSGTYIST